MVHCVFWLSSKHILLVDLTFRDEKQSFPLSPSCNDDMRLHW